MRYLKILTASLLLAMPLLAAASADVPDGAVWYFHVNLEDMRDEGPGKAIYAWLKDEAFADVRDDAGIDLDKELDALTAFSVEGQGPVILFEGHISQETKDKLMAFVAADGDLDPQKAAGKTYYHFDGGEGDETLTIKNDDLDIDIERLGDEAWVSLALKNKVLITGSEAEMRSLLAKNGKIAGKRSHDGALLVLSAEKTLLQAGMNSAALADGGTWDSNILRNTEQVAFLVAAAKDDLALEARLVTTQPEMAESLASVVRGLISLVAFDEDMDADVLSALQGTRVEASGNDLSISLAIDPDLVVRTLSE